MVTDNKARKAYNRLGSYCGEHKDCLGCIFNEDHCLMSDFTEYAYMKKEKMNGILKRLESEKENS